MSADVCTECGGDIVWDSDAGSAVCIGCGILQDPAQVVLDAHLDTVDKMNDNYGHAFPTGPSSVGFCSQIRWHLSGESKQVAAEANKVGLSAVLLVSWVETDTRPIPPNFPASPHPKECHEALYCGLS